MGCMLRSDKMNKCQMYLQMEVVFDVLAELGEIDCVQFIDLYPDLQLTNRNFVFEVCRYSEMEVKLGYIRHAMEMTGIVPPEQTQPSIAKRLQDMAPFEALLDKWRTDIEEMTNNERRLLQAYFELCEFHYVLTYIGPMLGSSEVKKLLLKNATAGADSRRDGRLMVTTGVVRRSSAAVFELLLWRICHGIIYYKQAREDKILIDPRSRQEVRKVAFLVVCQGHELASRVQKICNGFQVNTFPCPQTPELRAQLQESLVYKILDLEEILKKTRYIRCTYLRKIAKDMRWWQNSIRKSKAIFYTMNMFRLGDNYVLVAECWIPEDDCPLVNSILERNSVAHESCAASFNTKISSYDMPPTFHRTNKFTRGFQNLINAYGDSTYRELNPGLYTLITFPFLFAIMFGDMGHGLILVLVGFWMVYNEKRFMAERSENEIWDILFGGRYVILLMGLFSVYTGFFYNDLFSRALALQESYWVNTKNVEYIKEYEVVSFDPRLETRKPYVWGEDPVWRMARNKIMFENSFKMKMSIIVGVIHMLFGLCLSFVNYLYFKKYYAIFFQFIPEILFLLLIFTWMAVMIFMKWLMYSPKSTDEKKNVDCAPQILILFIDMALFSKSERPTKACPADTGYMFGFQPWLQKGFIVLALLSVPVLLLGSPIYKIMYNNKKRKVAEEALVYYKQSFMRDPVLEKELEAEVEKYSILPAELMIHQAVHTIEYVLSTISHTASYLRLWALSLAHSQLSDMLWQMILSNLAIKQKSSMGIIALIPIFALWALFTLAILVLMEGLSAFLHCLRLHWVEFMSKFYEGGGRPFRPFSFAAILADERNAYDSTCKKFKIRHYEY